MLAPFLVDEIRRLLAEDKLSYRKIAQRLGVNRATVGAIAAGRRPDYERLRHVRHDDPLEPTGPPARCPQCGGMVYLPCRLCHLRSTMPRPAEPRRRDRVGEIVQLQLKEEHRLRYEEVRAQRQRAEMEACLEHMRLS
jgi:transcriptional regulator with XRE-family HTH domain